MFKTSVFEGLQMLPRSKWRSLLAGKLRHLQPRGCIAMTHINVGLCLLLGIHQACHRARLRCSKPQMSVTAVSTCCNINALTHQRDQKPSEGVH